MNKLTLRLDTKKKIFLVISSILLSSCTLPGLGGTPTPVPPTQTATSLPATQTPTPTQTPPPPTPSATIAPTDTEAAPQHSVIQPQNVANITQVNTIIEPGASQFAWFPDDGLLAFGVDEGILLYNLPQSQQTRRVAAENPTLLVISPEQSQVAWASQDNAVRLWDVAEDGELFTVAEDAGAITSLVFSPQGDELAGSSFDNRILVWQTDQGQLENSKQLQFFLKNLDYSPDGSQIAGVDPQNFTVHFFDAANLEEIRSLTWTEHASPVLYGAFFSPDWQTLAWVARGTVQLMDVATGELGPTLLHEDFVSADVAWSVDGSLLATASAATVEGGFAPVVILWNVADGEMVTMLIQEQVPVSLAFSPDGRELGVLDFQGELNIYAVPR